MHNIAIGAVLNSCYILNQLDTSCLGSDVFVLCLHVTYFVSTVLSTINTCTCHARCSNNYYDVSSYQFCLASSLSPGLSSLLLLVRP